jgi:hypothetical protein
MKGTRKKRRLVRWSWQALSKAAGRAQRGVSEEALSFKLDLCHALTRTRVRTSAAAIPPARRLGVNGFGLGVKITAGKATGMPCVRVYVPEKKTKRRLGARELVPETVNGFPTDVVELPGAIPATAFGGDAVGYKNITTGTFGCVIKRGDRYFILSNNHVLADVNAGAPGDPVVWLDPATGARAQIAVLDTAIPLVFSVGSKIAMDAAIARILNPGQVSPQIQGIGRIAPGISVPFAGQVVTKYGGSTGLTTGVMEGYHEDISLDYAGRTAVFEGQLAVKSLGLVFTDEGDSGSLVLDDTSHAPVGLHFATDLLAGLSFCTPIGPILEVFKGTLVR